MSIRPRARADAAGHARRAHPGGRGGHSGLLYPHRRRHHRRRGQAGREEFDGVGYVRERWLRADLSIVKPWRADPEGNLVFRKTARNFNPDMATAGKVTIAEVEEIVPAGAPDPDQVHTPGVYVDRIIQGPRHEKRIEQRTVRPRPVAGEAA